MMNVLGTSVPMGNVRSTSFLLSFFRVGCKCSVVSHAWYKFHSARNIFSWNGLNLSSAFNSDSHDDSSPSWYRSFCSRCLIPVPPGASLACTEAPPPWRFVRAPDLPLTLVAQFVFHRLSEVPRSLLESFDRHCGRLSCTFPTPFHCYRQADARLGNGAYRPWAGTFLMDQLRFHSFVIAATACLAHEHQIAFLRPDPLCRPLDLFVPLLTRSLTPCVPHF